jgi:hypothetical protein
VLQSPFPTSLRSKSGAEIRSFSPEGEPLFDRTMILYGSNLGNANTHVTTNMPTILAGGGFKHGQQQQSPSLLPFALLTLFMLSPLARRAQVNRKKLSVADLHDQRSELRFWLRQPVWKRLEALELLRQSAYPYDPATARLPRLLAVVKRQQD